MMRAVSKSDLSPLKALLPHVLGSLAKESGRAGHLATVWEDAVGPAIAQNARPYRMEGENGDTLVLTVTSARWAHELGARADELCARLTERLGKDVVKQLVFRLGK